MFGNQLYMPQLNMPQQNMFQQPAGQRQFAEANYTPGLGFGERRFVPKFGIQGSFPPPGMGQFTNGIGVGPGTGIPVFPQGRTGVNPTWGTGPQRAGGQGFIAPGYPPQGFTPQPQQLISPVQSYPSQGYYPQGYPPQGYNQGYGGQPPVQPAWEKPKKSGIKGFISKLMAKRKG